MFSSNRPKEPQRHSKHKSGKSAKDKLSKLIASDSDTEGDSEHELSFYLNDRVKLMKEVLKIIKPRKIKSMAPDCMRNMELQEINSMLLEELLGISNKRLKYIFEGKTLDEESSTDEDQPVDVISLDDISDDDFVVISDEEVDKRKCKHKRKKIKEEPREKSKKVKKEKPDKDRTKNIENIKEKLKHKEKVTPKEKDSIGEENLMSVLELLELQARARAIRSQLELESKKKQEQQKQAKETKENGKEDDDEIIIEVPQDIEIVITSSDSENETSNAGSSKHIHVENNPGSSPKVHEEASQQSVTNNLEVQTNNDKEDGEVSDSDTRCSAAQLDCNNRGTPKEPHNSSGNLDSDSSSSDNLQVIKEREKRKKRREKISESEVKVGLEREEINAEIPEDVPENSEANKEVETNPKISSDEDGKNPQSKSGKIDAVIEEYMKTQPPAPDNSEELEKLEQQRKTKEEKTKKDKEKRLKNLKNKLQSFKQDVAVETGNVTVLENIVIKLKNVDHGKKQLEHSDDLVINVDQDDVDCMICD